MLGAFRLAAPLRSARSFWLGRCCSATTGSDAFQSARRLAGPAFARDAAMKLRRALSRKTVYVRRCAFVLLSSIGTAISKLRFCMKS